MYCLFLQNKYKDHYRVCLSISEINSNYEELPYRIATASMYEMALLKSVRSSYSFREPYSTTIASLFLYVAPPTAMQVSLSLSLFI